MPTVTVFQTIEAPAAIVFAAVSDIAALPSTNPDIVAIEFLTDQRVGVGTRFRETRKMGNTEVVTDLEVYEYDPDRHRFRCVADTHGTTWDTTMVARDGGLELAMLCDGHSLLKNAFHTLMSPMYRYGMRSHLRRLADYCARKAMEQSKSNSSQPS